MMSAFDDGLGILKDFTIRQRLSSDSSKDEKNLSQE